MLNINIPSNSLILLVGISSSGKSTFSKKCFHDYQILSSDKYREIVSNDENNMEATNDAFDLLKRTLEMRLKRGLITVIDATNLKPHLRKEYIDLAKKYHFKTSAIVFDLPFETSLNRLKWRTDRGNLDDVGLERQYKTFINNIEGIKKEGFLDVYYINDETQTKNVNINFYKLKCDKNNNTEPYWIVSNINGCFDEFYNLLLKLGYEIREKQDVDLEYKYEFFNTENKPKILLLGDFLHGGNQPLKTLSLILSLWKSGHLMATMSINDYNLRKLLKNQKLNITPELDKIKSALSHLNEGDKNTILAFFEECNDHFILDEGKIVVSYSGIPETMIGRNAESVYKQSVMGEEGANWYLNYKGLPLSIYGNWITNNNSINNNTININGNCLNGGKLIAFNSKTHEIISVDSYQEKKNLAKEELVLDLPLVSDLTKDMDLDSDWSNEKIKLPANKTDETFEFISKYSINPKALIYLPPTIPPVSTSKLEDFIEHPSEGFDYYRENGIKKVICQLKHMGSRGLVLLCRNQTGASKFNINGLGEVWSRTGRSFFRNDDKNIFLQKLKNIVDEVGLWDKLETDWILFDGEILPWSFKSQSLLNNEYAPVWTTAKALFETALPVLNHPLTNDLFDKFNRRQKELERYSNVYLNYADENTIDRVQFAPFHILAHDGNNNIKKDHYWHMNMISLLTNTNNPFLIKTEYKVVDVMKPDEMDECINWWLDLTENKGYEGIVMKPIEFIIRNEQRLVQPALKARGKSYLKMVYGPEYNLKENIEHHKKRSLGLKRKMATEQFIAGYESLERFTKNMNFNDWFKAVFITYGLASEKTDARL